MKFISSLIVMLIVCGFVGCQSSVTAPSASPAPFARDPQALEIDRTAIPIAPIDATEMRFEQHKNYLSMPLPYGPFEAVFEELKKHVRARLINRGEAHVTVLTPPEYESIEKFLPINEIDRIADRMDIQKSDLKLVCLGRGEATIDSQKKEQTYFIVVQSANLLKIRRVIHAQFVKRGGEAGLFNPDRFYPHITVGFSRMDLHESQGVIKDDRSCLYDLVTSKP